MGESAADADLSAHSACSKVWLLKCLLTDFWHCFFWGGGVVGFLMESMWRQISMVSILVCCAHKNLAVIMSDHHHLSFPKTL